MSALRSPGALAALALLFNALTWGVSWWPFRAMAGLGLHALWLTVIAFGAASLILVLRRPGALGELLRTPVLWVLVAGAGTTNACFNWAVSIGDVVRVVLLFYLMPLWTALLSRLLLGERISARGMWRVALALAGAAVVLWPAHGLAAGPGLGLADGLSLLGGFSFALNNVMLRREAHRSESARALAMFAGGALVAGALALALTRGGQIAPPPPLAAGWVLAAVLLAAWFLLANLALQFGAARLPANTTSVIMVSEVAFASLSSLALGAGTLDARTALGALLIVGAALLAAWQRD
ncbi:DMT family transporter [Aquabacterium sp. OR-4]|uniref:DMT family transporter n=1 Tax=Aquabacterium sp. OR-4 TaxID=2978127 RepID=UPI0021B47205|nr:DMT family transporter [Aquabacterium sp. OR-4]MDT7833590.1 DMT family transporter [Aquabacterium sp. OR-4]